MKKVLFFAALSLLIACNEETKPSEKAKPSDKAKPSKKAKPTSIEKEPVQKPILEYSNDDMSKEAICDLEKQLDAIKNESELIAALSGTKYLVKDDIEYTWEHSGCRLSARLDENKEISMRFQSCFNSDLPANIEKLFNEAKTNKDLKTLGDPESELKGKVYIASFQNGDLKKTFNIDTEGNKNGYVTLGSVECD